MTIHNLIEELTKDLNLTPEQQFLVTAKVKRLIHHEKASVYSRYHNYANVWGKQTVESKARHLDWLKSILGESYKNHVEWAKKPDKEMVTWDVGSFVYPKPKPQCYPDKNSHTFLNSKTCLCGKEIWEDDGEF